jgi:hypothetical protein
MPFDVDPFTKRYDEVCASVMGQYHRERFSFQAEYAIWAEDCDCLMFTTKNGVENQQSGRTKVASTVDYINRRLEKINADPIKFANSNQLFGWPQFDPPTKMCAYMTGIYIACSIGRFQLFRTPIEIPEKAIAREILRK